MRTRTRIYTLKRTRNLSESHPNCPLPNRLAGHRLEDGSRPAAFVNHFWGGTKPWLRHADCRKYFDFLRNGTDFRHGPSRCMGALQARLTSLRERQAKKPKPCYSNAGATRVF